jgi:hypothetical protein
MRRGGKGFYFLAFLEPSRDNGLLRTSWPFR